MKESWISVNKALPKLPDVPVCNMFVLACNEGDTKSRPMLYARRVIRGNTVEGWLSASGCETYIRPDFWQPLPKPPKAKEN